MNNLKNGSMFDCKANKLFGILDSDMYPWEVVESIEGHIRSILSKGLDGYEYYSDNVLVGKNVVISDLSTIIGPAIIGENTVIRPGAYIRENVIVGNNCVVGNSSELKNCLLMNNVQVPHYNYIGDSVIGNGVHLGAGVICSNLRTDRKNVVIKLEKGNIATNLRKVGAFLADGVDIGSSCVLNPGTVIGKDTFVYPLTMLRGVYPNNCIVKNNGTVVVKE